LYLYVAIEIGAQAFLNSSDAKEMAAAAGTFDFLLATIAAENINWDSYLDLRTSYAHHPLLSYTIYICHLYQ
jgi:D-arabinose 1-dehydrogenase-like Zn-dependent alcohol dehydrogenase